MIQFFKAYNFRSDRLPALNMPFANEWLNLAMSIDWVIIAGLSVTIVPVLKLAKWLVRKGRPWKEG